MIKIIKEWNYKKHATAASIVYSSIAIAGNVLLHKRRRMTDDSLNPVDYCRNMPKKQKIFNCVVAGMFAVDMTLGYVGTIFMKKRFPN